MRLTAEQVRHLETYEAQESELQALQKRNKVLEKRVEELQTELQAFRRWEAEDSWENMQAEIPELRGKSLPPWMLLPDLDDAAEFI